MNSRTVASLFLLGCTACAQDSMSVDDLLSADVVSGQSPATYVAEHPNAVVIFASPETCFSCQGPLLRILQQRAAPHKTTALYLTNPPDRPMRNLLVQYRLHETGILRVPPRVRAKQLTVVQLRAGKLTRSWANPTAEELLRVVASTGSDVEGR
jgi:hypothetical protein